MNVNIDLDDAHDAVRNFVTDFKLVELGIGDVESRSTEEILKFFASALQVFFSTSSSFFLFKVIHSEPSAIIVSFSVYTTFEAKPPPSIEAVLEIFRDFGPSFNEETSLLPVFPLYKYDMELPPGLTGSRCELTISPNSTNITFERAARNGES